LTLPQRILAVALAAFAALYLLPLWMFGPHDDLHTSWQWPLHIAFAEGWVWGRDIVWTYGPWGLLWHDVWDPRTYWIALACRVVIAAALGFALWTLARRHLTSGVGLAWLAGLLLLAQHGPEALATLVVLAWWALLQEDEPDRAALGARMALLPPLAWLALGKFITLVMVVGVAAIVVGVRASRRERPPLDVALLPAWGLLAWLLAGQPLGALPGFLADSWHLSSAFGQGFSLPGPALEIVAWLVLAGVAAALAARVDGVAALGLVPVAGLLFRHGFTRHDGPHAALAAVGLLEVVMLVMLRYRARPGPATRLPIGVVAAAGLLVVSAYGIRRDASWLEEVARRIETLPERVETAGRLLTGRPPAIADRVDGIAAELCSSNGMSAPVGTAEMVGVRQGVLLACGADYRPRPVIQGYQAYTPRLAALNADRLEAEDRPAEVWLDVEPLDTHYPSATESRSWLQLLLHYDVARADQRFLRLRRRERARAMEHGSISDGVATLGEPVEVPRPAGAGQLVWVTIKMERGFVYRLRELLWRPPGLQLEVTLQDDETEFWRLRPGLAEAGFLLSPRVRSRRGFVGLIAPGQRDATELPLVRSFVLRATGPGWPATYAVDFHRFRPAVQRGLQVPPRPD